MLFYFVCALLLLSSFTTKAEDGTPCKDQGGEHYCAGVQKHGMCGKPAFQKFVKAFCAKTCNLCKITDNDN